MVAHHTSEWVGPVGAHREHELENQFVSEESFAILRAAKLAPDLTELAGPVGEDERSAGVLQERGESDGRIAQGSGVGIGGQAVAALGTVETAAQEPAAAKLVIAGNVEAE